MSIRRNTTSAFAALRLLRSQLPALLLSISMPLQFAMAAAHRGEPAVPPCLGSAPAAPTAGQDQVEQDPAKPEAEESDPQRPEGSEVAKEPVQPADADAPQPPAPEWTDAQAKEALTALGKLTTKSPLNDRMQAVEALAQGGNRLLVSPLARVVRVDSSLAVRAAAARALGGQPPKQAGPTLMALLSDGSVGEPEVMREVVMAVERTGYAPRDWKRIEKVFEKGGFDARWVPVQQAVLRLVRTHKEQQAIPMLLEHLDEPTPDNVHAASNPPAEYWERRWKAWQAWRKDVVEALFAITGQRFGTAAEAKAWIEGNQRKLKQRRG